MTDAHENEFPEAWFVTGTVIVAVGLLPLLMIRMGWPRSVSGRRRLDGRSLVKNGMLVRDAGVIATTTLAALLCGAVAAIGPHSLLR